MSGKDKDDKYNQSLDDFLEDNGDSSSEDHSDYEDGYVYGDSDDVDYGKLGYEDEEDGVYSNPKKAVNVKGKYDYLLDKDEDSNEEEPEKLTIQEKISHGINKALDFIESKRFNTIQWVIALGVLIGLGVLFVVVFQASSNLESNVENQEATGAQFVAKEIAPEAYDKQTEKEELLKQQQEELDTYIEKNTEEYARQTNEMGEVPEGSVMQQDIDGNVSYVTQEEYDAMLNQDVRDNTTADVELAPSDAVEDMDIEIVPSSENLWHEITSTPIDEVNGDEIYQSRGQFIYFMQKALPTLYANQILDSTFDTDTYTMHVELNVHAIYPLPEDFEARMLLAYENSGYQTQAPNQFTIEYTEGEVE